MVDVTERQGQPDVAQDNCQGRSSRLATPPLPDVDGALRASLARYAGDEVDLWSSPNRDRRDGFHSLFQYPAMMVPIVQQHLIRAIVEAQPGIASMVDPFVGAGTTLVAAMRCGLDCYGQDINPFAVLLSQVKVGPFDTEGLPERVQAVLDAAKTDASEAVDVDFRNRDKWFQADVSVQLSRLRRAILREDSLWTRRFLWITLAETVRFTSNDRTSTYKLHMRPAERIG